MNRMFATASTWKANAAGLRQPSVQAADEARSPSVSVAARYVDVLRMLPDGDAPPLRATHGNGHPAGAVSSWRARHPVVTTARSPPPRRAVLSKDLARATA